MAISVSYLSLVRSVATSVVLLVLSLIAGQVEARAQSSDAILTPDERQRLVVALEKVKTNPEVHSLRMQLETVLRRDMLAADPSLGPVLAKIKGGDLEEIKAARDPANRAIEALSKATEASELRAQQRDEAEMSRQRVYEATAKKLDEINPDHKDAESKVLDLKLSAGKRLDSGQMQQLFSQMDRDLDFNHEQRKAILKETGYDGLKYDDFTGIIDWKATYAAAKEFAANNSAGENAKPSEIKSEASPAAPNETAPMQATVSAGESLPSPLLSVAVAALSAALVVLYRRKSSPSETQAMDIAPAPKEAWCFADCPRCEWRHTRPEGSLDAVTSIKCASCGDVFEPKWGQKQDDEVC